MTSASPIRPGAGDYVVQYQPRTPYGNPRLTLVRLSDGVPPTLVRATFTSAEDAGPRFEDEARSMAAGAGTRAFRCIDGQYTLLGARSDDQQP